jgi:hypothetical protein
MTDVKKSTEVKDSNTSLPQIQKSRYGTADSQEVWWVYFVSNIIYFGIFKSVRHLIFCCDLKGL